MRHRRQNIKEVELECGHLRRAFNVSHKMRENIRVYCLECQADKLITKEV